MTEFLSNEEQKKLAKMIGEAEAFTNAEIRIHIEAFCKIAPLKRAEQVFKKLNMHKTRLRNAVLFYIAIKDSKLAIWGDAGIHKNLPQSFWDAEVNLMLKHFKQGEYYQGIKLALIEVTAKLKELYPRSDDDTDELNNELSIGDGL